jgi:hypothetical protein
MLALAAPVNGQEPEPIGPVAVDLHGSLATYGQEPQLAISRGILAEELPSRGLGLNIGAHWYPVRVGVVTVGVGAALFLSRGSWNPPGEDPRPGALPVQTRFSSFAPQLSFNFGSEEGWSYISGGLGSSRFTVTTPLIEGVTAAQEPRAKTINYGGGARWFSRPHLAFSFDVRFYAISPQEAIDGLLERPRMTRLVISAGVSLK